MDNSETSILARKRALLDLQAHIGASVVQYGKECGITQREISNRLSGYGVNLSSSNLNNLKAGRYQRQLTVYTLVCLCEAVGKKITDFVKVSIPED